jgi:hypothetical protein
MSFVKLKHEIDEEEEEEEKSSASLKVLSKDLAYPMLSYFIYPKDENTSPISQALKKFIHTLKALPMQFTFTLTMLFLESLSVGQKRLIDMN